MKSKHRHELKTNDLAEWLSNFPQWAKKNRTMIIYISVVAVVAIGVYFWRIYQKNVVSVQRRTRLTALIAMLDPSKMRILQAQAQGFDNSYMLFQPAGGLQSIAQKADTDQMAALALIKHAEILRTELHYRLGTIGKQDLINQLNQARTSYAQAIEKSLSTPLLMAAAKFGIGLCEEEVGNFDRAEQIYRDIITSRYFEGTTAAVQAKQRLKTISDYKQKIVFKATPKETAAEPEQPQVELQVPQSPQTQNGPPNNPDSELPSQ